MRILQVEIKRTIPKGSSQSKDFKTKKIFVGGIPSTVSEGTSFSALFMHIAKSCMYLILGLLYSLFTSIY